MFAFVPVLMFVICGLAACFLVGDFLMRLTGASIVWSAVAEENEASDDNSHFEPWGIVLADLAPNQTEKKEALLRKVIADMAAKVARLEGEVKDLLRENNEAVLGWDHSINVIVGLEADVSRLIAEKDMVQRSLDESTERNGKHLADLAILQAKYNNLAAFTRIACTEAQPEVIETCGVEVSEAGPDTLPAPSPVQADKPVSVNVIALPRMQGDRVECPCCGKELSRKSLKRHVMTQHPA